ncbi:hypothetical protein C5F59_039170 [Streptomyces sp. QL37]|uniref:DUF7380 domain-containing protein n=1 Tax=Streptomyces sp. QL37 TaxID=2093747 RepID=UPI000CF1E4F2|nr:hypothetical protein [Streptomyces sp. QL37]PPQ62038.1 hypothetical protein C5F59_39395 [Streptomyces sp. QL37]
MLEENQCAAEQDHLILILSEVHVGIDPSVLAAVNEEAAEFISLQDLLQRWVRRVNAERLRGQAAVEADALWAALCFHRTERGALAGSYLGQGTDQWPANPQQVTDVAVEIWAEYADAVTHPMLAARLHHLVWEARRRFPHVRKAIQGYLEAVPRFLDLSDGAAGRSRVCDCLLFAHELAVRLSVHDLEQQARQAMTDFIRTLLDDPQNSAPGLVLEVMRSLVARQPSDSTVRTLLGEASRVHAGNTPILIDLLQLRMAGESDLERRTALQRQIITAMLDEAERLQGFVRVDRLNAAAVAARNYGLEDLFDTARLQMQAVDSDKLGLTSLRFEIPLQRAELEGFTHSVLSRAQTPAEAFGVLAGLAAPTGTREASQDYARTVASEGLLSSLIPTVRINPAGPVPVSDARVQTAADHEAQWHVTAMLITSAYVHHLLEAIGDRFDPTTTQLTHLFTARPVIPPLRANKLAQAFRYYWSGEQDAALALALPRIEGILRELLRHNHVPIVQPAQGDTRGRVTLLTTLIDRMTDVGMDADWQVFLRLLLVDSDGGLNLRNSELHDLSDSETVPQTVALVLLAALYLTAQAQQATAPTTRS